MTGTGPRRRPATVLPVVPRLVARAQAQRGARRRRNLRWLTGTAIALVPVAGLVWLLYGSTVFGVDRVQVTGAVRTTPAEVELAAGLSPDVPLARVDLADVEAAVSRLTPVAEVTARRSWPGTVQLAVRERAPVAAVPGPEGVLLVDGEGVVFAAAPEPPPGVVRLEVPAVGPHDPATRAALQVWRDLPSALRSRVQVVRAPTAVSVVLLLADGRQVVWGGPGDTASKAAATSALLALPGSVVDVSAPGVAVRR